MAKVQKIANVLGSCNTEDQLGYAVMWANKLIRRDLEVNKSATFIAGAYLSAKNRVHKLMKDGKRCTK